MTDIQPLLDRLTFDEKLEAIRLLEAKLQHRARRLIERYYPDAGPLARHLYRPHMTFFKAGATRRERLFLAGNRVGKSEGVGAYELALHLTGQYPEWWEGRRFNHSIAAWAAGETVRDVRDTIQRILLGPPGQHGTGMLPGDCIIKATARAGTVDAVDTVTVRHASGGTSTLTFKSYEGGRESFQGAAIHCAWMDEEPPMPVFTETLVRTMTTDGLVIATFTPLLGMSDVVLHFLPDGRAPEDAASGPFVVTATWDDVPHLTPEAKAELWASIPPYLRDARSKGIPQLGAGAIYPLSEDSFLIDPLEIPPWWPRSYGLDVGWRVTAAVFGALDRETDTLYLYDEYVRAEAEPAVHAAAIRARGRGAWLMGAVDPAARGRQQVDGEQLIARYREHGLQLTPANNAVEAGLLEVWQRLSTGRLRVFRTLQNWLGEYRLYRRDERGRVVKERDHCMDATRYLAISGVHIAGLAPDYMSPGVPRPAEDLDYNPIYGIPRQRRPRPPYQSQGLTDRAAAARIFGPAFAQPQSLPVPIAGGGPTVGTPPQHPFGGGLASVNQQRLEDFYAEMNASIDYDPFWGVSGRCP